MNIFGSWKAALKLSLKQSLDVANTFPSQQVAKNIVDSVKYMGYFIVPPIY
jgi:hypothetical protein